MNTANLSIDECAVAIIALLKERELRRLMKLETENTEIINNLSARPVFKNPAEVEFARILDMYQIQWKYEPKTFPIEWDAEGNVTLAFSPDFYLIQFDTYIELTTMNQKYVTLKNKKIKKLREIYPGTNVKIVYKKDFQSLIERFRPAEVNRARHEPIQGKADDFTVKRPCGQRIASWAGKSAMTMPAVT